MPFSKNRKERVGTWAKELGLLDKKESFNSYQIIYISSYKY